MSQKKDYTDYHELHEHPGTEHYEVITLIPKDFEVATPVRFNMENSELIPFGKTNPLDKREENRKYTRLKISASGDVIDEGITAGGPLLDGTIKGYDFYSNWIIDGDTTKYKFVTPDIPQDISSQEWLNKLETTYKDADCAYYHNSYFYFKSQNKWYKIKKNKNLTDEDYYHFFQGKFKSIEEVNETYNVLGTVFPEKYNPIRIAEFKDLMPDMLKRSSERDTSFINKVGYEEKDREKEVGLNPISYSAGYYYLELYMPLGDTVKIKRFGSMDINMQAYKIPAPMGGRNDVVFLVQEPEEMNAPFELGGMYVVRPRDPEQQQYGPHKSSADTFMSGTSSKGSMDPVGKFLEVGEK